MQPQKKHFPVVGLVTLVVIAAVTGSLYYYQFITPHATGCGTSLHRVFFVSSIIQEDGGFTITGAAIYNETSAPLPAATNSSLLSLALNFTGAQLTNVTISNPKTIEANVGDTVTIYMFSVNSTDSRQYAPNPPFGGLGHGFGVDNYQIPKIWLTGWNSWGSTTFPFQGGGTFRCEHQCSLEHGSMTGNLSVGGPCG